MAEVVSETDYEIDGTEFVALVDYALTNMYVAIDAELNILFIDPKPMEDLHVCWLDLLGLIDVMSFSMDKLRPRIADRPTPAGTLGGIYICPQIAEQQAKDAEHTTVGEMPMLATHEMLRLLGYDHAEEGEKKEMFALQRILLLISFTAR